MSNAIKMNFQTLPNVPFLQGWPGILAQEPWRKPPAVHGLLEFRPGSNQIKARSLQIEFIRIETLPGGGQSAMTVIGAPVTVWQTPSGKEWDVITATDFKFYIPLPLNIPGTVELKPKGGGIRYELVANLSHKPKSGLLRRDSNPITRTTQAIFITKHEQHSAWPIYNQPETRTAVVSEMELTVVRNYTAFGPSDRIEVLACLRSSRPKPLKLRAFHLELIEVLTIRPPVAKGGKPSSTKRSRVVHESKVPVGEKIARTEEKKRPVALVVPAGLIAHTTKGGKVFDVAYELSVKAIMEGMEDVKIEHLQVTVGIYGRPRAHDMVNQIGMVDALCPFPKGRPNVARTDSQTNSIRSSIAGPSPGGQAGGFLPFPEPRSSPSNGVPTGHPGRPARNSYYGPANPLNIHDLPPQTRLAVQPFNSRPLSIDSSSIYSHPQWQSQSDVSSVRDLQSDAGHGFARTRPNTFGLSDFHTNVLADTKRMSWSSGQGLERGPSAGGYGNQTPLRPAGPSRTPTAVTVVSQDERRLSSDNRPNSRLLERPALSPTPSRHSFVHQDGGRVILDAQGQVQQSPRLSTEQQPAVERTWDPSEMEKHRLYTEARRNAALTQLSGGADLEPMGMSGDVPHEPPPEYSPQSASQPRFVLDPPSDYPKEKVGFQPGNPNTSSPKTHTIHVAEIPAIVDPTSPPPWEHPVEVDNGPKVVPNGAVPVQEPSSSDAGPSSRPRHSFQPLSDKEQMKRYYEAQARIGQNTAPVEVIETMQAPPPVADKPSRNSHQPISDKEAMRRFYEAQDQMAQAQALHQAGSSSQTREREEDHQATLKSPPPSLGIAPRFMSATEEKDMMKRRYEQAARQVSDHHTQQGDSENGHAVSGDATPTRAESGFALAQKSGSAQGHSQWPSAEDEKETMKRRYDDAVAAMGQTSMHSGPLEPSLMETGPAGPSHRQWQDVQEDKPQSQSWNEDLGAPPPPLPARPNEEYKKLLSPDLMHGMPLMPLANPYLYGNPMMNPAYGMPISPTYGGQEFSPPMAPLFGMGVGMMPNLPVNPYAYNMPPGQAVYPGGYHSPITPDHPRGEGSSSGWNGNSQDRRY